MIMSPTAPATTDLRPLAKSTSSSTTRRPSIFSTNSVPPLTAPCKPPSSASFKVAQAAKSKAALLTKALAISSLAKNHLASGATKQNQLAPTKVFKSPR
ncbi:hypothetical protein IG631_04735 [Alternaria alternata]|nr:hypothetical protein IG631_04735 [Alternaria alternata]